MKKCIYIICFLWIMIVHSTLTYPQLINHQENNNNLISNEIDYYFNEKLAGTPTEFQLMPVKFYFDPLPELNIRTKITIKILKHESFDDTISYRLERTCGLDTSPFIIHYDQVRQTDELKKQGLKLIEGEFYMVPREVGGYLLDFRLGEHPGYRIYFRLDESGKLVYLAKDIPRSIAKPELPNHPPLNTETVKLHHPRGCRQGTNINFDGYLLISPPFSLNTVSTVDVHLTALADNPDGVQFEIANYPDIIITDSLTSWIGPIKTGDKYTGQLKIKPTKPGGSYWGLSIIDPLIDEQYKMGIFDHLKFVFPVFFAMDNDGKAYYIGTETITNRYYTKLKENREKLNFHDNLDKLKRTYSKPTLKQ